LLPAVVLGLLQAYAALAVFALGYLLALGWLALRWVLRPLRQLAGALRHIERGRYRPWMQAPPGPLQEVRMLHRGLHLLWEGLERRGRARDAALEELSRREEGYRGLFESNPNIMWITDAETLAFLAVNDAAIAHYGYSRHEFLSMSVTDLLSPEDREELAAGSDSLDEAPGPRYLRAVPRIWRHVTRPGRILLVEVERHELEFANRPARLCLVTDVTRRLAGEARLRERLDDANGQLAQLRRELSSARSLLSGMSHVSLEGDGLQPMLRRLQRLTQLPALPFAQQVVDLSALAEHEIHLLRLAHPSRRVHVEIEPGLVCAADAGLARQVVQELLANAWRFTRDRPNAWIRMGQAEDADGAFFVSDNGIGFDATLQSRLYLPFERLHSQADYPGDGLGLAMATAAVQRHEGRLWAQSQPGQGATFFFTLAPSMQADDGAQVAEVLIEEAVPQD
jgi:PAS domain S-box-containing protein